MGLAQSYSIQLKVYAQPYFIKEPESQTAAEGETVTFECEAGGYPAPQVTYRPKVFEHLVLKNISCHKYYFTFK